MICTVLMGVMGDLLAIPCKVAMLHPILGCAVAMREVTRQDGWEDAYCSDQYFIKSVFYKGSGS